MLWRRTKLNITDVTSVSIFVISPFSFDFIVTAYWMIYWDMKRIGVKLFPRKKPIYFALTVSDDNLMGLRPYLIMEGLVYKVVNQVFNVIFMVLESG